FSSEYATVKYDSDGNQLWAAHYDGLGLGSNYAVAIAVDLYGNVYVTGVSDSGYFDYATVKYDSNGNQLWEARYHHSAPGVNFVRAMALDAAGNVYVTGDSNSDYATVKYDSDGNQLWVARYHFADQRYNSATGVSVDAAGSVYVTGRSDTADFQTD